MLHQGAEQHIAVTGKRKDGENPSHTSQCRNRVQGSQNATAWKAGRRDSRIIRKSESLP